MIRTFHRICIAVILTLTIAQAPVPADRPAGPTSQPSVMRLKRFSIIDEQGFADMEVFRGVMPADWTVKGGVLWRPKLATPQLFRIHWGDAQDVRGFDLYPSLSFSWSQAVAMGRSNIQPGSIFAGFIVEATPKDAFSAFDTAILQYFRKDLQQATVIKQERLPDVSKRIYDKINVDPNTAYEVAAGREIFEYNLNGQVVDESLTGVMQASMSRENNPNGVQYWQVTFASSRRAPKGTLDDLTPLAQEMAQSLQINPAWLKRVNDLNQERYQQALDRQHQQAVNQQQWFNATEQRIANQSAANDAQHASYWAHSADLDRQSENEADIQREVSPWQSSDGSTYKLPSNYGQAWQGSDGEILMNNDPGYNPNSDSSMPSGTSWTQMQPTHN
jgi:hypothetical protein